MRLQDRQTGRFAIPCVSWSWIWAMVIATAAVNSRDAKAESSSRFVQLASPGDVICNEPAQSMTLASCCRSAGVLAPSSRCDEVAACDSGCDRGSSQCTGWGVAILDHLTELVAPSDRCFDDYLSPMTNPVFFEDPRTLTEARFIYFQQKVPLSAAGGNVDLFLVQFRAALNDRLSIIATKDGFLTSDNPLIDDGWSDVNLGLKYNLMRCPDSQVLYSVGVTYEMPVGSTRSLQGNGDGSYHVFSTGGTRWLGTNLLLAHGWIIPTDGDAESEWFYFSGHASHRLGGSDVYALAEINSYHWIESGANGIPGMEGLDVFNLGSTNVTGNDIVTGAFGLKYKPRNSVELGVAWENPLTERRDIIDNRLTVDCILRY